MKKPTKTQITSLKNRHNPHAKLLAEYRFSPELLDSCWDHIKKSSVVINQRLPLWFLKKHEEDIDWGLFSIYQRNLGDDVIREYMHVLKLDYIIAHNEVSEELLDSIIMYSEVSEELLCEITRKTNLKPLRCKQKLSEGFIQDHHDLFDEVTWYTVSGYGDLSEDFIEEFSDHLDWEKIFDTHALSYDFICRHIDIMHGLKYVKAWHRMHGFPCLTEEESMSLKLALSLM